MKTVVALIACVAFAGPVNAEPMTGLVSGRIVDEASNEPLIGASVLLIGTTMGTSTDLDGEFEVEGIPIGVYDLRFTFFGYERKTIKGIMVKADESLELKVGMNPLNADASPEAFTIEDIRVVAERILSTDAAVLADRLKAATIGDAISAEQISKSPDATSGDALKRVTGLSVVDDKYVFIRGTTDRYNATMLNGVMVTSTDTDVDKKSFSFDMVPAALLANTVVHKTVTPDVPGDVTGGLVNVNTIDFPSERVATMGIGGSYNKGVTNEAIFTSRGGSKDYWGIDDGIRDFPGGDLKGSELARALPNTWGAVGDKAPMAGKLNFALGNRYRLGGQDLGFVGAFTYKNSYDTEEFFFEPKKNGIADYRWGGTAYRFGVLWGGLFDLNYRPLHDHKFYLKNNFNHSASERIANFDGEPPNADFPSIGQAIEWDERRLYVGQLGGDHLFPSLLNTTLRWNFNYAASKAKEPDRKYIEYKVTERLKGKPGYIQMRENYRTWTELTEDTYGFSTDLSFPTGKLSTVSAGYLQSRRERDYGIEAWFADAAGLEGQARGLIALEPDEIFAPENFDNSGVNGFAFREWGPFSGEYTGEHRLNAYYGMADLYFTLLGQQFRFAGGARFEDSDQVVVTIKDNDTGEDSVAEVKNGDLLPRLNFNYMIGDHANFRLAYSETVNRPEFRELSDVLYYDYNRFQNVRGNPNLKRATIENYDFRTELFFGFNHLLAVSLFRKDLTDPIEETLIPSPERYVLSWFNSPEGRNDGYEIELRTRLGWLAYPFGRGGRSFMDNFSLTGNYTHVESEIRFTEQKTDTDGNRSDVEQRRPMQGIAPWMVNASFGFDMPWTGTTFTALFNKIGRRIWAVGDERDRDVYEEPRDVIDLALTQRLFHGTRLKFAVEDLTADDIVLTSEGNVRSTFSRITTSTSYSLTFSYKF